MLSGWKTRPALKWFVSVMLLLLFCVLGSGCREVETIQREIWKKLQTKVLKKKKPFIPREGITMRSCSLYQTANPNSEVIRRLPAETPIDLLDKVGDWYRVRTRDQREGYLDERMVGGEDIIVLTRKLRKSIEGMPVQAEGAVKSKANFRLEPGREPKVVEVLQPGKKLEMYERVVTLRRAAKPPTAEIATRGRAAEQAAEEEEPGSPVNPSDDQVRKDVWYKVKLEDGRVGYIYTHNIKFTPPADIAKMVPFMRLLAWRTISTTDDPDMGSKNNYVAAYAPIGKDAGCDYTRIYNMNWSRRSKRHVIGMQIKLPGVLPITNYHFEGKPGFSVRYLHPTNKDKLVLKSYVLSQGRLRAVSEEEIPNTHQVH